jgi:S1-C subfamily serine protease
MRNARPVPEEAESAGGALRLQLLPVTVQSLTPELAEALTIGETKGVLVSSSQHPKILRSDVILAVGTSKVQSVEQLAAALDKAGGGKEVELKISREQQIMTVRIKLEKRAEPKD